MRIRQWVGVVVLGLVVGCGGSSLNLKAGPMPSGTTFLGVWQSPQYGNMHLCQSGSQVFGDYVKNERYGRIQGDVKGDILRFFWEDHRELVQGVPMVRRGKGYFRISMGEDGDEYLTGEWGLDKKEHGGGPWNAVKLRRGAPDRCMGADEDTTAPANKKSWDDEPAADNPVDQDLP
jgi:hypothetical protein